MTGLEWPVGQVAEIDFTRHGADGPTQTTVARMLPIGAWVDITADMVGLRIHSSQVTAVRPLRLVPDEISELSAELAVIQDALLKARRLIPPIAEGWNGLHNAADEAIPAALDALDRIARSSTPDQSPVPVPRDEPNDPGSAYADTCGAADCNGLTVAVVDDDGWLPVCSRHEAEHAAHRGTPEPLTLAGVFRALADVHAQAGSKSPVRMFTDAAEDAERDATNSQTDHPDPLLPGPGGRCPAVLHCHETSGHDATEPSAGTGTPAEAVSTAAVDPDLVAARFPAAVEAAAEAGFELSYPEEQWQRHAGKQTQEHYRMRAGTCLAAALPHLPLRAEAVSGGSGHAERQGVLASLVRLLVAAETEVARLAAEVARVERERNRALQGEAEMARRSSELATEVARYRAAIEAHKAVCDEMAPTATGEGLLLNWPDANAWDGAKDALAAALGDGETQQSARLIAGLEQCGHGTFPRESCPQCGPSCSRWCCQ